MVALPAPTVAGEELRYNQRDYIAFDDGGTLVWSHDHAKFVYFRDYADNNLSNNPTVTLTIQTGYIEIADLIIQWTLRPITSGLETWTYPKAFTSTALPAGACLEQRTDQTDTEKTTTLYNIGTTSLQYRSWTRFELEGAGEPTHVAIAQQTGIVINEQEQVPAAPTVDDELDWNGRHMLAVSDGVKEVWFLHRRAYGYIDNQAGAVEAQRYMSVGNMLINMEDWPSGGGVRQKTFNKPFGPEVKPALAASAESTSSREVTFYTVDESGCEFKTFTATTTTTGEDISAFSVAALNNPYPNPIRWPVPSTLGERFHYRRQFYVAVSAAPGLVWAMDPDYRFDIDVDHITSPETAEKIDFNSVRILAAPLLGGASNRTETFDHPFGNIPRVGCVVSSTGGQDRGGNVSNITETTFDGRAWDWGGGLGQNPGAATSDPLHFIAIGLADGSLLSKLIAYWTLDGSTSADKEELLKSGWDFRSAAGADSELAVRQYGARQDSTVDPAMDKWFNLETLAWHNSGNAYFDGTSDFGISFWFYPDGSGTSTLGVILGMSDDGSPIEVVYDDDTGTTVNLNFHDVDTSVQSSPTVTVTVDQWNFLYFGWTASSKTASVILNDNARQSSVLTVATPLEELNDGEPLTLLRRTDDTDPVRGILDELGLWKADLSDAEVARLYNDGLGTQGPDF